MNKEELKEKYGKKKIPHQWRETDFLSAQICTFFGSGMSPKAPGTMGSLAAAFAAYPMAMLFAELKTPDIALLKSACINVSFMAAALIVFFAAIPFVKKAMNDTKTEDPGWIVIDEVCGIFMSLAFVSTASILAHPWILVIAFGIFRFFDILKPLGIHKFEAFPGAWGVMADDLLGGFYTGLCMVPITLFIQYF